MKAHTASQPRNLGIDALRCAAMLLICCLHVMNRGGALSALTAEASTLVYPLKVLANCGVNLYALISGWVLVYGRFRPARIVELWLQVLFWNLLIAAVGSLLDPGCMDGFWLRYCLPLTQKCFWYFTAYVGLYALTPLLNPGIRRLSPRQARGMVWAMLLLFGLGSALGYSWQGDPWGINAGYSVLWLLVLYVMGACARHGGLLSKAPLWKPLLLALGSLALICAWHALLLRMDSSVEFWRDQSSQLLYYTSPLLSLLSLSLLLVFSRLRLRGRPTALIRWLSALSFGVYIIHVHHVFWTLLQDSFVSLGRLPASLVGPAILLSGLGILLLGSCLDWLRLRLFSALRVRERVERLLGRLARKEDETP